jgi:hypothetical protein
MQKEMAVLCTLVLLAPSGVAAQSGTPEQEVRPFLAEYEEARARRDIQFLERVLPVDYGCTGPNAKLTDREGTLQHFRRLKEDRVEALLAEFNSRGLNKTRPALDRYRSRASSKGP